MSGLDEPYGGKSKTHFLAQRKWVFFFGNALLNLQLH